VVSLKLRYSSEAAGREMLSKRDALIVIVQAVFASRPINDVAEAVMRPAIIEAMNRIMESGRVADVEFEGIQIERRS
jgi:hypothetical protein